MFGAGNILKQAKKMQEDMEKLQSKLAETTLDISSGGGAIKIKVNGQGEFTHLSVDPEFLKEDSQVVSETLLAAIQEASVTAKNYSRDAMQKITAGLNIPGLT